MEEYLLLEEAARRYRISAETLERLVESGRIRAVKVDGRIAVPTIEAAMAAIQAQADGELVSINEAGRRLGIDPSVIWWWWKHGWLKDYGRGPRNAVLILLKDAQILASLRADRGKRGRRLIPRGMERELLG